MPRLHLALICAALTILAALAGCDSTDDATAPDRPDPIEASTWNLDPDGGVFAVTGNDGSRLQIDLPANALRESVTLAVTPRSAGEGLPLFTIQPAGTILRETATVIVDLPDGVELSEDMSLAFTGGGRQALLPTIVDPVARRLEAEIHILGYDRDLAKDDAPTDGGIDQLQVILADCEERFEAALDQLYAVIEDDFRAQTVRPLLDQLDSIRLDCEQAQDEVVFAQTAAQACTRNAEARIDAWNVPSDLSMDTVRDYLEPLFGSQALITETGADCDASSETEAAAEHVLNTYVDHLAAQVDSDAYLENTTWPAAWYQIKKALNLGANAALVGQDAVETRVDNELLPAIMDQLRRAAYRSCRQDHYQDYLADILSGGHLRGHPLDGENVGVPGFASYGDEDIRADMHLGASALTVEVFDGDLPPVEIESERRELGGGDAMGDHVTEASITVPADGQIRLSGDVYAFLCYADGGSSWAEQQLRIEFAGEEYAIREHEGDGLFFDGPWPYLIEMSELLEQLHLDPGAGTVYPLEIWRIGTPCNGLYDSLGPSEYRLFAVSVYVTPVTDQTLTGAWAVTVDEVCQGTVNIVQDGDQLSADGSLGGQSFCPFDAVAGEGTGNLDGQSITLGLAFSELGQVDFTGTVSADFNAMSGTYTGTYSGTWTAVRDD